MQAQTANNRSLLAVLAKRGLAGFAVIAVGFSLTACGGSLPSLNPFAKEEKKLPGDRIAVMPPRDSSAVELPVEKTPIRLPKAARNAEWTQPGGNATNSPGHLSVSGSLRQAWRVSIGKGSSDDGQVTGVPIVFKNRIYTIDAQGNVSAFSASGGARSWRIALTPENEKGREGYGGGLAVDSGRLYAVTGFGTAVGLNPANGKVLWTKKLGVPVRSSPTASGGKLFFVTTENRIYCMNGENGEEVWSYRGVPGAATLLSNVSPAVSGDTAVVPLSSGDLVAYKVSAGKPVWADSLAKRGGRSALSALSDPARPVIDRGLVFAVGHSGRMVAIAANTGERIWTRNIRSTQMPWVAGDTVFVADENSKLMALSRRDGKVRWVADLPQSDKWNGPVLASNKLWLISAAGLMVGVDPNTGQVASKVDLDTPVFIAPVVAAGRMYVLADNGRLMAFN